MSLWVDKHRPTSLSKLDYHKEQAGRLKKLVSLHSPIHTRLTASVSLLQVHSGDFPHLLVYGPSGAGKKTRIMCLLRELFGAGAEKLRIEHMTVTVSRYHWRCSPGFYLGGREDTRPPLEVSSPP